jgi:hypothetical protein
MRPWELTPVLEQHRLVTLARVAVATRNRAFAEADREAGDTNWGLACKAHERLMTALGRLSAEHPWLNVVREGLYVMPLIDDVPVRLYRGAADKPGPRHLEALRLEHERSRPAMPQMYLDFVVRANDGGPWYWLMAMETGAAGQVSRVVFVQANDAGETRHPWECPLDETPHPPAVHLVARPGFAVVPPRRERRPLTVASEVSTQQARTLQRAHRALGFIELLVPTQIADEELGDAMEIIVRLVEQSRPPWLIYLRVVTMMVWVVLNAFRASARRAVKGKTIKGKG